MLHQHHCLHDDALGNGEGTGFRLQGTATAGANEQMTNVRRIRRWIAVLLVLPATLHAGDITFTRDYRGDEHLTGGYLVTAPEYTVQIQADGCLYNWRSGDTTLVGQRPVGFDTPKGLRDLRQIDGSTLLATDGDRTVVYRFSPDGISMRLKAAPEGLEFFTEAAFRLSIPRTAQAVADSYFGKWDALPTHRYWPNFDVLYDTGDEVRVFIGNDLPAPDLENFELLDRTWTLQVQADAQWHSVDLYLRKAAEPRRVAAAPDFTIETTDNPHRIFFQGGPAEYVIAFDGDDVATDLTKAWLSYRVSDYWGEPVLDGRQELSLRAGRDKRLALKLATPRCGWFLLEVTLDGEAPGLEIVSRTRQKNYAVYRQTPELVRLEEERAIAEADGEEYRWTWERTYYALGAKMRRVPFLVSMAQNQPAEGEFDWEKSDAAMEQQHREAQQYGLAHFTQIEGAAPWAMDPQAGPDQRLPAADKLPAYQDYCEVLARRYREQMPVWEVFNEPNIYRIAPERYYERLLAPAYKGIKAGDPDAQVMGGTLCGVQIPYHDQLYKLGAGDCVDQWGFHPYCVGDWEEEGIGDFFESFRQLMAAYDDDKPMWVTEFGYMFTCGAEKYWGKDRLPYGRQPCYGPQRQPRAEMIAKAYLVAERHGIPRRQFYYYYYPVHGFQPHYVIHCDGSLMPAALAILTLHDQLRDARFVKVLPLPQRGVTAAVFEAADRQVVAAWTHSFPLEVRFRTDAPTVQVTEMMGSTQDVEPREGLFAVTLSGCPTYIALPREATLEEEGRTRWGENLARKATASASSGAQAASAVNDGLLNDRQRPLAELREPKPRPPCAWQDETPGEFPDWVELAFPQPTRVNAATIYSRSFQTLRDYDLECLEPGQEAWRTLDRVRGNVVRWGHHHRFPTVEVERLRVKVLYTNAGLMQSHPLLCGHKQSTFIREIEAFLVEEAEPSPAPPKTPWHVAALAGLVLLAALSALAMVAWIRHRSR